MSPAIGLGGKTYFTAGEVIAVSAYIAYHGGDDLQDGVIGSRELLDNIMALAKLRGYQGEQTFRNAIADLDGSVFRPSVAALLLFISLEDIKTLGGLREVS